MSRRNRVTDGPGTPTPGPPYWVTPVIIAPTATAENAATAQWRQAVATAQASLYGTPTPWLPNVWTATPLPGYRVVTNTPTPANWSTALAQAIAEATRRATAGPPTPFPPFWITATPGPRADYAVVTSTPRPQNWATSQAISARATIVALSTGTYTPVPRTWVTPTPLLIPVERLTPTTTPTATPSPRPIPGVLRGKIAFKSDRLGAPQLFVMDPDEGNVAWLTQSYPYDQAQQGLTFAPDGVRRVFVQPDNRGVPQLYLHDPRYDLIRAITGLTGSAYHPAWAPNQDVIAFVATEAGNDEIYLINVDGSGLQRLTWNTWEWDKHPSWSPDGAQIVFYSNRGTRRMQIWLMEADGSEQHNISDNEYTVTHPDMRRFFMTIPEAVQLVLQAAALGQGGEVFVLDMGEPVRIVDLATDLIRLSGLRPRVRTDDGIGESARGRDDGGWDVEVVFTGVRPGEKLSEALFADGEECHRTRHDKILVAVNGLDRSANPGLDERVARLADLAQAGDEAGVQRLLKEIVPEYRPVGGAEQP